MVSRPQTQSKTRVSQRGVKKKIPHPARPARLGRWWGDRRPDYGKLFPEKGESVLLCDYSSTGRRKRVPEERRLRETRPGTDEQARTQKS